MTTTETPPILTLDADNLPPNENCFMYHKPLTIIVIFALIAACVAGDIESAKAQTFGQTGIHSVDIFGKQCFKVQGIARTQLNAPHLFDHVIMVDNQCFKPIKFKVCYTRSETCTAMAIPARSVKEGWLGSSPMRFFQYDIRDTSRLFQ